MAKLKKIIENLNPAASISKRNPAPLQGTWRRVLSPLAGQLQKSEVREQHRDICRAIARTGNSVTLRTHV